MEPGGISESLRRAGFFSAIACLLVIILAGCIEKAPLEDDWGYGGQTSTSTNGPTPPPTSPAVKIDDWQYSPSSQSDQSHRTKGGTTVTVPQPAPVPSPGTGYSLSAPMEAESLGFAVGGAKDINNFRENIENGYLPVPTDVTYEGLFYDYYFDTGQQEPCQSLFCPSYSYAITEDPFSGDEEYYLSVGLNSGMTESDFERKKLNLVVVLDISGSMGSQFNRYYYDRFGNRVEPEGGEEELRKSKIEIARESVAALLDHLNDDDRFGMVLFNDSARLAKPLNPVGETDMDAIAEHILDVSAGGGTYMSAGMDMATGLYDELLDADQSEYENRIIFLTDAMPNIGETSEQGLLGMTESNAGDNLYTTFIGIGVDFNSELVEFITKIRGANYYSVHSADEFERRMDEEFEYMVTPLVFNLELVLKADGWEIEKVYGSPEADEATGDLMKVNTLFPSKSEDGETRGGQVLLKLRKVAGDGEIDLTVSYEDRDGNHETVETNVEFDNAGSEYFANTGIRKGVLLSRYADLLINWLIDEREHAHFSRPWEPVVDNEIGIPVPPPVDPILGKWERQSLPLMVSREYHDLFAEFMEYFGDEMQAVGDQTLEQELDILSELI